MNIFGLNPLVTFRRRLRAVFGVFVLSAACCSCGALMTFVLAPGQAIRANRIAHLPVMSAAGVDAAVAGDPVLITGVISGSPPHPEIVDFIAYAGEKWVVTIPAASDPDGSSEPFGSWTNIPTVVPELSLEMDGQAVSIHTASNVRLSGSLHELVIPGESSLNAKYDNQPVSDGTVRYHGLDNGVLATVLGKKAADGGVDPEQIFAGNRAAFEESQRQATSGFLISGIFSFVMAPIVLFGGLLAVLFWRRR
jgi:hypothetical protein